MRSSRRRSNDRGAAAVEFALVAPLLIALLMGIMEFGYAFFVQGTIAGAAREAARDYAIHQDVGEAKAQAVDAGNSVGVNSGMVTISADCSADGSDMVTATVTVPNVALTGFFGHHTITATGAMRCGG